MSDITGNFNKLLERIVIFVGNLSPLFIIVFIIYLGTPYLIYTLAVMLISITLEFYWVKLLKLSQDSGPNNVKSFTIKNASDSTTAIMSYFLTYTVSVPAISVIGGIKGFIVLLVLLIVIYLVLYENRIAFYNPFLFLFKYKMYHFETTELGEGYLISKVIGIDFRPQGLTKAVQIDDFIYITKSVAREN